MGFGEAAATAAGNMISPGYLFMETFIGNWRGYIEKAPG
jgi:hypothetical protein